jgi:S-adenosylmethionine hydrolase
METNIDLAPERVMKPSVIAIITDFGYDDPYVGIMKGIISAISPDSTIIDLTHNVPPGDIQQGAFVLWQSANDFPAGTIFLTVIDPGVGSDRKGICLKCRNQFFIGPDNGLFSYLSYKNNIQAWELANREYQLPSLSNTFHGRDIFAPAAAYSSLGISPDQFGNPLNEIIKIPIPRLSVRDSKIEGEILTSDHFGNLITSLGKFGVADEKLQLDSWLNLKRKTILNQTAVTVRVRDQIFSLASTFSSAARGIYTSVIGSTGLLEIICNQSSAKELLSVRTRDPVQLLW